MSNLPTPELSRPIKVKGLPGEAVLVEADAAERIALAARFDLPGIDTLHAEIDLETSGNAIRARGNLQAAIRQTCAISGEDFPSSIAEELDFRFVEEGLPEPALGDEIEVELDAEDCDEITYTGDTFDLGEAVAQSLGLAIDPYAEGPGADAARKKAGITAEGEQDGPLAAALAALKND